MSILKKASQWLESDLLSDVSLFIFRVTVAGLMALNHGYAKFSNFSTMSESFPDPLQLGSSKVSLALAVGGEFFACLMIVAGLMTRLSAVPAFITMVVAGFVHHQGDPLKDREAALLFAVCFFIILVRGPGRISLDGIFKRL